MADMNLEEEEELWPVKMKSSSIHDSTSNPTKEHKNYNRPSPTSSKVESLSAPMNICRKISRGNGFRVHDDDEDEDDDEEEDVMVPPHEFLARKMARRQISSFSMCEGIGRTLKGRDLSKLRNAILIQTGFLEL